jgi:hypothetical protein
MTPRPTPPLAAIQRQQERLLQRLFGADWERAADRIAAIEAAKARRGGVR